jgi:hypothetical protein
MCIFHEIIQLFKNVQKWVVEIDASLHGWPYLNRDVGNVWRTIWIIFLIIVCGLSVFVIVRNVQQFVEATTVTTIDSTMAPLKDVTFPSIYICNINQVNIPN